MAIIDSPFNRLSINHFKGSVTAKQSKKNDVLKTQLKSAENITLPENNDDLNENNSGILGQPNELEREEVASLVTIFRQRREWEKKSTISNETSFDQILDEGDTLNKIEQFYIIAKADVSSDMRKFFAQLSKFFPDESDMFLVLKQLLKRKSISKILRARIEAAIIHLEETVDPKILKGGINVALKARLFSASLDVKPPIIRVIYRQFLEDENEPLDIYYKWVSQFGFDKRLIVLEFIQSALITDMMSLDPSCTKIEFGNLLSKIKQLNELYSTENMLFKILSTNNSLMELNNTPLSWFVFFYYLIRSPETIEDEMMMLSNSQIKFFTHKQRGEILQTIYQLVMNIPIRLFDSTEYRELLRDRLLTLTTISFKRQKQSFVK